MVPLAESMVVKINDWIGLEDVNIEQMIMQYKRKSMEVRDHEYIMESSYAWIYIYTFIHLTYDRHLCYTCAFIFVDM